MARCFCGCEEKVGFSGRGYNKQGKRTKDQLELLRILDQRLKGAREDVLDGLGDSEARAFDDLAAATKELIEVGEGFEAAWHSILHDGHVPLDGALAFKQQWLEWGKRAMNSGRVARVSTEGLREWVVDRTAQMR